MTTNTNNKRRRPSQPCSREGCPGYAYDDSRFCSFICKAVALELENAQRACEALGDSELTTELWTEAVELSDVTSRFLELRYRSRMAAKDRGFTRSQWQKTIWGKVPTT